MTIENETVVVRNLRPRDLDAVILLDSKITGRKRTEYFKTKLAQALADTGIVVSLAAEVDGQFVGFLLARVYYGEFGATEQTAVLDTIGVNPNMRGQGVGTALMSQLRQNLLALGIGALQTEVSWDDLDLMGFFQRTGFRPASRICLDLSLRS
ncbi:MAG: GNAT family N-acetyltransferase [Planctomycetota bacterium]